MPLRGVGTDAAATVVRWLQSLSGGRDDGGSGADGARDGFAEATPDGAVELDGAGRVRWADGTAAAVLGVRGSDGDPVGSAIADLLPGIESGPVTVSATVDGAERTFEARPPDGPADGWLVLRDVTVEREQADAIQRYETVVDALGDAVYVIDADGRFTFVNEAFETQFGWDSEDLLGEHVSVAMSEVGRERARTEIDALLAAGDRTSTVFERTVETADGETVPVEDHMALLPTEDDEFRGTAGVLRDVSDRKRRAEELQQYETIMQALPDPVYATDDAGDLTFVNRAFEEQLGYDRSAVVDDSSHFSEFTTPDGTEAILDALRAMLSDGTDRRTVEIEGVTSDGRTLQLANSISLLPHDDGFRGSAGVLRNVADRRRREEVFRVMNRALRHNLRSNVNTISGYAEVLAEDADGERLEHLERIREAAEWLAKLGDTLRTLQDAIDESLDDAEGVTAAAVVDEAVAQVRDDHPDAAVSVHHATRGTLAAGFPLRFAVENVVENALVHNDADDPWVDVWVADAPRDGWIDVHVEDNGPGIPPEERAIVLGEADTSQLHHGSGIGLWITRWLVQVYDGEVHIEANEPRGSVVTLRLRRADAGD